jgi:hypothetical protein
MDTKLDNAKHTHETSSEQQSRASIFLSPVSSTVNRSCEQ